MPFEKYQFVELAFTFKFERFIASPRQILFVSDIHVEPWYDVDGTSEVSRFKGADVNNMWQCRNSKGDKVPCTLEGHSDPPYPMFVK